MNKNCNKPKCGPAKCRDDGFVFRKVLIPAALGDDVTGQDKPANGAMTNAFVTYEANGNQYLYDSYGVYTKFNSGDVLSVNGKTGKVVLKTSDLENDSDYVTATFVIETANAAVSEETNLRIIADNDLQTQIDAIAASSDVTDIVGTYAELEAYDTSKLNDNDIIKVLQDETHNDETTYYRWIKASSTFSLIGEEGPYYTKAAADQKFQDKLTAGSNITIDADNVISSSAAAQTIFYANSQETGATRHIYKDAAFTQAASAQELLDANEEGPVVLRITTNPNPDGLFSDAYIQNTYVGTGDYQFLFLDERTYREYAASTPSDTTFYYFSNTIQSQLTAGDNITINNNTISSKATKRYYFDTTSATPIYSDSAGTTAVTGKEIYDASQNSVISLKDITEHGIGWEPEQIVEIATDTGAGVNLYVWGAYGSNAITYADKNSTSATVTSLPAGPTVVQTTGTSQTDVMSQKAASNLIYQEGQETGHNNIIMGSGASLPANATQTGNLVIYGQQQSGYRGVAIGKNAQVSGNDTVAIGGGSTSTQGPRALGDKSVAVGSDAVVSSSYSYSVALGSYSQAARDWEVSVGGRIGNAHTRYIANVTDPQDAQDAATKNYTDNLTISYAAINNAGAPTTATEAKYIGQLYYDTTNSDLYYCSAITPQGTTPETYTYTWTAVGGGPTVVQTIGTSTTDVMSQAAASELIYPISQLGNVKKSICIGGGTASSANDNIVIGRQASTTVGDENIAIGFHAQVTGFSKNYSTAIGRYSNVSTDWGTAIGAGAQGLNQYSASLGDHSRTSRRYEVSIGSGQAGDAATYKERYLANVKDPSLDQDAATKHYVDGKLPTVLTTANYDYPSGSPDSIAVWDLAAGEYKAGEDILLNKGGNSYNRFTLSAGGTLFVSKKDTKTCAVVVGRTDSSNVLRPAVWFYNGSSESGTPQEYTQGAILTTDTLTTSLSNSSNGYPFDSRGAKTLNENKLAVSNLHAGTGIDLVVTGSGANRVVTINAGGTTESYTIADTDWAALSSSSPYTYSADVTATYTIGAHTVVELLNDQAVNFATYGFAIGAINGQTVTIYSIGAPSSSVTLKVNYKG